MKNLRIGVIGTGGIAAVHLKNLRGHEGAEIAALCDVSEERLRSAQTEFGGEAYTDFEKMLAREMLDGVVLSTPTTVRKEPIEACAARGIPIFIEKPPATSVEAGRAIEKILLDSGLPHFVGFVFRWATFVETVLEKIRGRKIYAIQSHYFCDAMFPESASRLPAALYDKKKSGGIIGDQGIHILDLVRYLTGSEARSVSAIANNVYRPKDHVVTSEETVALQMEMGDGSLATHLHSWAYPKWEVGLFVFGEGFDARFQLLDRVADYKIDGRVFHLDQVEQLHCPEMKAFLELIRIGDRSLVRSDYSDALKTLELVEAVDRALESGEDVNVAAHGSARK